MRSNQKLTGFNVLERESGRNFLTWTYPSIPIELKEIILSKCFAIFSEANYYCLRKKQHFIYIQQIISDTDKKFAIILIAQEYDVNKYKKLCDIFSKTYAKTKNPVDLVRFYVNIFTKGSCHFQDNGCEYNFDLKSYHLQTNLKDLINEFGLEIVLIYTALLLKKRVIVYHEDVGKLQQDLLAISKLLALRNVSEYLHPLVENINQELKGNNFYVVGSTKRNDINNESLYDLFVDLSAKEIFISTKSKDYFTMTKIHKEIAIHLVKLAQSTESEENVVKEIELKAIQVCTNLKKLLQDTSKCNNTNMQSFLCNFAQAEGIPVSI